MALRIALSAAILTMLFCLPAQAQTAADGTSAPAAQPAVQDIATPPPDPATALQPPSSLDEPIEQIADTPTGCAVLDKDFPGLRDHPMYPFFKAMTLNQIAAMSGGKITPDMLAQAKTDLTGLILATPAAATGP
jgi:hypothetical protein